MSASDTVMAEEPPTATTTTTNDVADTVIVDDATSASPAPAASPISAGVVLPAASRTHLYSLIIRQLRDDGLENLAVALASQTALTSDPSFSRHHLATLVDSALAAAQQAKDRARMQLGRPEADEEAHAQAGVTEEKQSMADTFSLHGAPSALLDLTAGSRISTISTAFPAYSSRYGVSHNSAVTCAAFSSDGALAATGGYDSCIKLLDVTRMRSAPALNSGESAGRILKKDPRNPVVRNYFDHEAPISEIAFHPFEPYLLSASRDATLKLFNYSSALTGPADDGSAAIARKCSKVLALENSPVASISFHPSGDFVLVGTEQLFPRLYDVQSFSAYVSPDFANFHRGPITAVRFHPTRGSIYATASLDGAIKLWDGVSSCVIRSIDGAHGGAEVSSIEFSPSGQYLLSTGKDSTSRLWSLETDAPTCIMTYRGTTHQASHVKAQFEHSGEFVCCGDEVSGGLAVWDTRTSEVVRRLDCHSRPIRALGVSPTEAAFITCGDDARAQFWTV